MTPREHAEVLRDAVRRHVSGGGEQHLDQLLMLAESAPGMPGEAVRTFVRRLADDAWNALDDENRDRQVLLEGLIEGLRSLAGPAPTMARVLLFKSSGKYYTEDTWRIPDRAHIPHDMAHSPDFRRIDGGAVLVPAQEPWGYPHLILP